MSPPRPIQASSVLDSTLKTLLQERARFMEFSVPKIVESTLGSGTSVYVGVYNVSILIGSRGH